MPALHVYHRSKILIFQIVFYLFGEEYWIEKAKIK